MNSVYIGGIPFELTEDQVLSIVNAVGPLTKMELLFDQETGRSKGCAYVTYNDPETAALAVRNLNNMSVGTRYLRCAFSSDPNTVPDEIAEGHHMLLPPLPLGTQLYQNQSAQQAISGILLKLDLHKAAALLKEARTMSLENPLLMKKLLDQCPQLAHALVETSLMTNATKKETIELCLNRHVPDLEVLSYDHVMLLQEVKQLTDKDIEELDESQKKVVSQIKEELSRGSYGIV